MNDSTFKTFFGPQSQESFTHVWFADLDKLKDYLGIADTLLSEDERERADRFYFEHDRHRFVLSRALLRLLLARYLDSSPNEFIFSYNEYGKPQLIMNDSLSFNISHSQNFALFAFSTAEELGVDIEVMNSSFATLDIAERFFSPDEIETLHLCADDEKTALFYNCWTRKEAYIKAKGKGLSIPLDSFSVDVRATRSSLLRRSSEYPKDEKTFCVHPIAVHDQCRAAIAASVQDLHLAQFNVDVGMFDHFYATAVNNSFQMVLS